MKFIFRVLGFILGVFFVLLGIFLVFEEFGNISWFRDPQLGLVVLGLYLIIYAFTGERAILYLLEKFSLYFGRGKKRKK